MVTRPSLRACTFISRVVQVLHLEGLLRVGEDRLYEGLERVTVQLCQLKLALDPENRLSAWWVACPCPYRILSSALCALLTALKWCRGFRYAVDRAGCVSHGFNHPLATLPNPLRKMTTLSAGGLAETSFRSPLRTPRSAGSRESSADTLDARRHQRARNHQSSRGWPRGTRS